MDGEEPYLEGCVISRLPNGLMSGGFMNLVKLAVPRETGSDLEKLLIGVKSIGKDVTEYVLPSVNMFEKWSAKVPLIGKTDTSYIQSSTSQ